MRFEWEWDGKSFMKKDETEAEEDELRPEYDLSQLKGRVRGKYAESYREGTNLTLLEPDEVIHPKFDGRD